MKSILGVLFIALAVLPLGVILAGDLDRDGLSDDHDCRPTIAGYFDNTAPMRVNPRQQPQGIDSDSDGVPDYLDNRPYVMEYFNMLAPVRQNPADQPDDVDSDHDGLPDHLDNRPYAAEYFFFGPAAPRAEEPKPEAMPRKAPDSDKDGVPDVSDKCPNTPPGVAVDDAGCPRDSDGDGITDDLDRCPNTPTRVEVDASGCPKDTDGDGVPDYLDKEINSPAGAHVDVDGVALDSDRDGVIDLNDKCANTPKGVDVDETGCPKILKKGEKITLHVEFATNSADMDANSREILDGIAQTMKDYPDIKIRIAGFTDDVGSEAYNLNLSKRRAKAVLDYLADKGVSRKRMSSTGHGEDPKYFVGDNKTDEGRQQNRRVEIESVD